MLLTRDVCTQGAIYGINKVLNAAALVVWLEKAREYIKQCVLASCLKLSCYMYICLCFRKNEKSRFFHDTAHCMCENSEYTDDTGLDGKACLSQCSISKYKRDRKHLFMTKIIMPVDLVWEQSQCAGFLVGLGLNIWLLYMYM